MAYSAASPVAEALYAVFQDAALQAALPGGMHDDVPGDPTYPFGWYEIPTENDVRGFGTGGLPEVEVRVHIFSHFGGLAEAQAANRLVIGLLRDVALSVTGYTQCGRVIHDGSRTLPDEELHGVKVHEVVSFFRIYVEES
jgi:hypothetical protein